MRNNLQIFRQSLRNYLESDLIENQEQFKKTINHLCDQKLLHPQEIKKLINKFCINKSQIKFPINLHQLQQIIMTQFGDKYFQEMLANLQLLKKSLRQTKGVLSLWKDKGLTEKQRYELQSIFQKGNSHLRQFYQVLQSQKINIEQICEQDLQMIDSLNEWIKMQKVEQLFKDYQEYQSLNKELIEQLFNQIRVRQVHFKTKKNTAKVTEIEKVIALDSKNDNPVEVLLIPKRSMQFNSINIELLTFNAKKQLLLSSYFNQILGYNTYADSHCFLYFSQFIQGKNLQEFINNSIYQLEEETPLFKYWTSSLFRAFSDIFNMCSYLVKKPIELKDIIVCNSGLKLVIKNIKFIGRRAEIIGNMYEAELLQNLGFLIMKLLKIQKWQSQGYKKLKKIQNISLLNCMNSAVIGHKHFQEGRVKNYINFFNLQVHPLFESKNLLEGQTVIQNYQEILSLK